MAMIQHTTATTPANQVASTLNQDGVVIVDNLLKGSDVDELLEILKPEFDAQSVGGGKQFGNAKKSVAGIFRNSPKFAERLLTNKLINEATGLILGPNGDHYRLTVSGAGEIWKGGEEQYLHREIDIYAPYIAYDPGSPEYVVFAMFAASDFTRDNGATRLVPGSHRWPADRKAGSARPEEIAQAEMVKGSVVMWLGKTVHGLGANRTDQPRRSFGVAFSVDWLAQEENQYVVYPPDAIKHLSVEAQRLIGYRASPGVGWVRGRDSDWLVRAAGAGASSGPTGYVEEPALTT